MLRRGAEAARARRTSERGGAIGGAASRRRGRAAEVPLATVEACLELVATAESLAGRSNVNASSDLNVAALLGEAAARGAAENVLVNLPAVGDEAFAGEATARVMGLLDTIAGAGRGDARRPSAAATPAIPLPE